MSDVSEGATHLHDAYDIVTYYKWAHGVMAYGKLVYYGVESHEPYCGWWYWSGKEWKPDTCVNSTHFKQIA